MGYRQFFNLANSRIDPAIPLAVRVEGARSAAIARDRLRVNQKPPGSSIGKQLSDKTLAPTTSHVYEKKILASTPVRAASSVTSLTKEDQICRICFNSLVDKVRSESISFRKIIF